MPALSPTASTDISSSRNTLRQTLRQRRRALDAREQVQASEALARNLLLHPDLRRARHLAVYLPNDGEIDPYTFVRFGQRRGMMFYLPVLHPIYPGRLVFASFDDSTPLIKNRFGIPEPEFGRCKTRPAWAMDAVLFPLVGFDEQGGRLGMGGGFYDRTFEFTRHRPRPAPKMIGLAHECQKSDAIPMQSWDIPLHSVVTDQRIYRKL